VATDPSALYFGLALTYQSFTPVDHPTHRPDLLSCLAPLRAVASQSKSHTGAHGGLLMTPGFIVDGEPQE
jgi:hypothetical protein